VISSSDANKDLNVKARTRDLTLKAKARITVLTLKVLILKVKDRTKDLASCRMHTGTLQGLTFLI